jgi:hypothetical protein
MLSASQWTSSNLIRNCNGIEGPTGESGPYGPDGPIGDDGVPGPSGPTNIGPIGIQGEEGIPGEIGVELPLYVYRLDSIQPQSMDLNLPTKYQLIVIYLELEADIASPIRSTNIRFRAGADLVAAGLTDYWVRIKLFNYTLAYGADYNITANIFLNDDPTASAVFDVYPAWREFPASGLSTQTMYIWWRPSSNRLQMY